MNKLWVGRCAVCGKTNGHFEKATYEGAPDGGVTVHPWCLEKFYMGVEEQAWKEDVAAATKPSS